MPDAITDKVLKRRYEDLAADRIKRNKPVEAKRPWRAADDPEYMRLQEKADRATAHVGAKQPTRDDQVQPALEKAYGAYSIAKSAIDSIKQSQGSDRTIYGKVKAEYLAARPGIDPDNMTQEQQWELADITRNARWDQAEKDSQGFLDALPKVGDIDTPALAKMAGTLVTKYAKWADQANVEGPRASYRALDILARRAGIDPSLLRNETGAWYAKGARGPMKVRAKDRSGGAENSVYEQAFEYATSGMKDGWTEVPYSWSRPNAEGMKTEKEMLDWYSADGFEKYKRYLGGIQYAQGINQSYAERDQNWINRAEREGLLGKLTPFAIAQRYEQEAERLKDMEDFVAAFERENVAINGIEPLDGSAVYGYGEDVHYYGDPSFNLRSEPVSIPERSRWEGTAVDRQFAHRRLEDDSPTLTHVNSKNTTLTVPHPEVHSAHRAGRGGQVRTPMASESATMHHPSTQQRAPGGVTGPSRYMEHTPSDHYMSDAASHVTYDPSVNPGVCCAVVPSGEHTEIPREANASLSENAFLVGIGDDEHTTRVNIGTMINNEDYGSSGAEVEQPEQVPVEEVNAANATNPQAPIIKDKPQANDKPAPLVVKPMASSRIRPLVAIM